MVAGFQLDNLQLCITKIQALALSDSTKCNYHSVWNTYLNFCQFYSITPFPASSSTIASFIALLSFSVKSHHTVNNYLSALRCLHVFCHFDTSAFDDIHVKLTQKGLEKAMVHLPRRKAPLTSAILLQFYCHLNIRDVTPCGALCLWVFSPSSELPTSSLGPWKSSPLIKSCPGVESLLPALALSSQLSAPKHVRLASLFGLGSPLEASGPLGYSIKMPKQIRWWSMLSLGEWEGQQGIIVHIPRNNLIRPRPSRFVAWAVLVITSCHLISLLFVCLLSGRFVHPPSLPGESPLEASGPLGYSIKMPKQIRWWSVLSLGEWEGQQGIIVHIPRNNLIRPRPSRFVAWVVLVITSCHLISLLFVCLLSGRFVHPPSLPGESPLEASGPLGYSIKMPKQIRWWSVLSLGEWEGQQGIICLAVSLMGST